MPRKPTGPRYFPSLNGYYIQLNRQRICLAKGPEDDPEVKQKAWAEFHATMSAALSGKKEDDNQTVYAILNAYLGWVKKRRSPNSYAIRKRFLQSFSDMYGKLRVRDLTITHIEDWLDKKSKPRWVERLKLHTSWGASTKRTAVTVLSMALRWAADRNRRLIKEVPISFKGLDLQPISSRGENCLISDEQHSLLLSYARKRTHDGFTTLLLFLKGTGARPAEVYLATAQEFNEQLGAWVIRATLANQGRFKLLRRGKDRTVYIPTALIPLVRQLNVRYPDGPIFRAENGKPWNVASITRRFARMRKAINRDYRERGLKAPMSERISAYSYRHAFATNWLNQGRNIPRLCEILNTSLKMLQDHYGHLAVFKKELRQALDEFTAAVGDGQSIGADSDSYARGQGE